MVHHIQHVHWDVGVEKFYSSYHLYLIYFTVLSLCAELERMPTFLHCYFYIELCRLSSSLLSVQSLDLLLIELVVLTLHPAPRVQIQVLPVTAAAECGVRISGDYRGSCLAYADLDSLPFQLFVMFYIFRQYSYQSDFIII